MEAVMACWEIEQSLQSLTGVFHTYLDFFISKYLASSNKNYGQGSKDFSI